MASENSLYTKVRLVIEDADRRSASDGHLADAVIARGHPAFLTLQYEGEKDDYIRLPSRRAVLNAIHMAGRLEFLAEDGSLTSSGQRAARSERSYRREMTKSLHELLATAGATTSRLQESSRGLLRKAPPVLPTAPALWEAIDPELSRGDFSRLLSLLAEVGGASTEQRKAYMRFGFE